MFSSSWTSSDLFLIASCPEMKLDVLVHNGLVQRDLPVRGHQKLQRQLDLRSNIHHLMKGATKRGKFHVGRLEEICLASSVVMTMANLFWVPIV